jgi:pyruvate/2-oxoglutarate dehydrogenase complex dihydrolipoamide dehydrogenase (E3) component
MGERYDAIVIGAGPGGEVAAAGIAAGGMRVAIVERELVAGECSYWACMPTKALLRPGEALVQAKRTPGARSAVTGEIDVPAALAWRDSVVAGYDDTGQVRWLGEHDIDLIRGIGSIDGPGRVRVGDTVYETDRIVIATGSSPVIPPVTGLREADGVWTNREATSLTEAPESIIVLGGGAVGVEIAQALARFGAKVSLVEGAAHLMSREPAALGEALRPALESEGVEVLTGRYAAEVARAPDGRFAVRFEDGHELRGHRLLVATGRVPRVEGIGLETIGIAPDRRGVPVDERMRVTDGVWAVGDVTGILMFTHVGKYQGRIAAADILGKTVRADYRAVPRVVFTDPEIAAVGETEGPLTATAEMTEVPRWYAYTDERGAPGFLTLVSDGERLTGAYGMGPGAGDWLQQATVAIRAGVPLAVLRDVIQPFPTFSEIWLKALDRLCGPDAGCVTSAETSLAAARHDASVAT